MKKTFKILITFFLVLLFGLLISFVDYTPPRDYSNLTEKPLLDTSINPCEEIEVNFPKWKLSKKRLTDKRMMGW